MNTTVKKKVLFVIDTLQIGGAEQSLLENTSRFENIQSVVCHLYKGEALKQKFVQKGVPVYSFNIQKKYGFVIAYKKLKNLVLLEKPDLIVAYLTRSEIVARLVGKFTHVPVVGTFVNDLYCDDYNRHLSLKAKVWIKVFKQVNKFTSTICIGFIANSDAIKNANARHLNIIPEKIKVINRGRDSFNIATREDRLNTSPIKFVNVSRLFTVKAQNYLINAFMRFLKTHPDATLHIIGDGPLRTELTAMIKANNLTNKVSLLGARKDVAVLLAQYDCFVFPSLVEGFSGAIVEAMFAKLPVLASDIQQNKEAIRHKETGYLFKKESVTAIEEAMQWFASNREDAQFFAEQAYQYAKKHFEQSKIVAQLEGYLHSSVSE